MVENMEKMIDLGGLSAVVTGGAGVLCAEMCRALAALGANVAILDINPVAAEALAFEIRSDGYQAVGIGCNVLEKESLQAAAEKIVLEFGGVDILINGAGGNKAQATTSMDISFFDLPSDAIRWVFELNLVGTILPSQVFGKLMAEKGQGNILNISSMNAFRPLTRIPAYSAAKAGVSNFTQWLAVHMAQDYSSNIRVNAIAPGFFLTEQNRFLLTEPGTGEFTARGKTIIAHTPMNKFGVPSDLVGTMLWLVSSMSSFVTGVVVPVDGGFSAFSGV
jgi:NAD(P)-dependent dehydrogenase (short-subunit alcohol dehydrogenase family)